MKEPQDCGGLEEVRAAIDTIDREILRLIARRGEYVAAAAAFKESPDQVKDEKRAAALLKERRAMAKELSIEPDFAEELFKKIVAFFIKKELQEFKEQKK